MSTEDQSKYTDLETYEMGALLNSINDLDQSVANAVQNAIPQIECFCSNTLLKMKNGGRLFYVGSGTSGRLGIVDASECPPTYGVPQGLVVGIIAGGDPAIRVAVENAEDDPLQGWYDLQEHSISKSDFVLGISASGGAPYILGALEQCKANGVSCGAIACNTNSEIGKMADHKISTFGMIEVIKFGIIAQ